MTDYSILRVKSEPSEDRTEDGMYGGGDFIAHHETALESFCPAAPAAIPVSMTSEPVDIPRTLETLAPLTHSSSSIHLEQLSMLSEDEQSSEFMPLLSIKDEPSSEGEAPTTSGDETNESQSSRSSGKSWTAIDMENALQALRQQDMTLTKASAKFGIPSTTLWQRAHRAGIDTPKRETSGRGWQPNALRDALSALRQGKLSANKASKAYGIPSSTLYKVARREGIRLVAPFHLAGTAWRPRDLQRALAGIRRGDQTVQRAAHTYGIPTGTLYGRCKREGIELSRSNPTPWSEDAMGEALEAVRIGQMSINQAAIHFNLPYSSLYGRFKRCKYNPAAPQQQTVESPELNPGNTQFQGSYQTYQHDVLHPIYHNQINQMEESPSIHYTSINQHLTHDQSVCEENTYNDTMYYYNHSNAIVTS